MYYNASEVAKMAGILPSSLKTSIRNRTVPDADIKEGKYLKDWFWSKSKVDLFFSAMREKPSDIWKRSKEAILRDKASGNYTTAQLAKKYGMGKCALGNYLYSKSRTSEQYDRQDPASKFSYPLAIKAFDLIARKAA